MDLIALSVIALGVMLWYLQYRMRSEQLDQALDALKDELSSLMLVTLEKVQQDQHEVVLVYDFNTDKFICQGVTEADCGEQLKLLFPDRKILVVTEETA